MTSVFPEESRQGLSTLKKGKLNRFVWGLGGGGLKITDHDYRRKLIATTTKASPLVEENTEEEQETLEKEEDPVLSRRRRPNVVLRGGYNLEYQNNSF